MGRAILLCDRGFPALQPLFSTDFRAKAQPGCDPILCSSCTIKCKCCCGADCKVRALLIGCTGKPLARRFSGMHLIGDVPAHGAQASILSAPSRIYLSRIRIYFVRKKSARRALFLETRAGFTAATTARAAAETRSSPRCLRAAHVAHAEFAQARDHRLRQHFRRRCARRHADAASCPRPIRIDLRRRIHHIGGDAALFGHFAQAARIRAVRAADHDHDVALRREKLHRVLAVLRRVADVLLLRFLDRRILRS